MGNTQECRKTIGDRGITYWLDFPSIDPSDMAGAIFDRAEQDLRSFSPREKGRVAGMSEEGMCEETMRNQEP